MARAAPKPGRTCPNSKTETQKENSAPAKAALFSQQKDQSVSSLPNPASQVKPNLGETNGDREFLMQVLRAATARAKLISNTLDSIGVALRQRAVSVEEAMQWAKDEQIIDLLQFGPPSRGPSHEHR